jgi:hypothetical protein
MRGSWIAGASLVAAAALAGCAPKNTRLTAPVPPPTVVTAALEGQGQVAHLETVQVAATVVSVDARRRRVTLRGSDGKMETLRVGADVRNLLQVRRGDRVVATYTQAVAIRLARKGTASPETSDDVVFNRAPAGELPGGSSAQVVTIVARIIGIDRDDKEVTLRGADGRTTTIEVDDPARLEHVRVGDLIEATFVEGVTIAVERTGVRGS